MSHFPSLSAALPGPLRKEMLLYFAALLFFNLILDVCVSLMLFLEKRQVPLIIFFLIISTNWPCTTQSRCEFYREKNHIKDVAQHFQYIYWCLIESRETQARRKEPIYVMNIVLSGALLLHLTPRAPICPTNVLKMSSRRPNPDSSGGVSLHYYLGP